MGLRDIRTLTALVVIGLSAWTISYGWSILRFSYASATAISPEARPAAVGSWAGTRGIAGVALEASLTAAAAATDLDTLGARGRQLAARLSGRPMSSMSWLSLASIRFLSGQPLDKVLAALTLSSVTGANEGQAMSRRGVFGLWQWENMPSHVRRQMAADLAVSMRERAMSSGEQMTVYEILVGKPADTRREIADLLRADGLSAQDLRRIGL